MSLPPELGFLEEFYIDPHKALRAVDWLLSDFDSNVWEYDFGFKAPKRIDWDVELNDGSRLIDKNNKNLLESLKYFLTGSTQANSASNSKGQRSSELAHAIHIVDFLLLHAEQFKLSQYGLAGLGRDSFKLILSEFSSNSDTAESIYGWSSRMYVYCLKLLVDIHPATIDDAIKEWPNLAIVTPDQAEENLLDIPYELIPRVRAALHLNGLYGYYRGKGYTPNSVQVSNEIYRNTLRGRYEDKPIISILTVPLDENFTRECHPVRVTTGTGSKMSLGNFNEYKKALYKLGNLHDIGMSAPSAEDLISAKNFKIETESAGRFRTLPSKIVFGAVRDSIEFYLKHGTEIVNGFCRAVLYCKKENLQFSQVTDSDLQNVFGKHLTSIGVESIGLTRRLQGRMYDSSVKGTKSQYFTKLRANYGLIELVKILIGCTQIVVGALMGRRVGELLDLQANDCLDASEKWLVFANRKSSYMLFGSRQVEIRPIEPIAVKMIKNLVRMQKILRKIGFISKLTGLFASPSSQGGMNLINSSIYNFNQNIDLFCDYFETPTNESGQRYYIRQHQLRRFFAMLFFYSSSFGGLETLQWMLGHTDVQHIWHYITESMDGATLAGAKAQYVAEALHSGDIESYKSLAALVTARYGTENFTLADTNELEDYLADLMEEGAITIEPEFFEDGDGQRFKVIAKVVGVDA